MIRGWGVPKDVYSTSKYLNAISKSYVINFIFSWISARLDNELNFFAEYIIRLNQPDIYNNYINLVCFETLNLNS